MKPKPENEAKFLKALKDQVFHVDDNGQIWRIGEYTRVQNVRAVRTRRAELPTHDGYLQVGIGRITKVLAHRAVWLSIHGFIPEGTEINHKNGIRSDNDPLNLEPLTPSANTKHSYDVLSHPRMRGESNGMSVLTHENVVNIRQLIRNGNSHRKIAQVYGVSHCLIGKIRRGELVPEFPDAPRMAQRAAGDLFGEREGVQP